MDVRVCCLLLFVAAFWVAGLANDTHVGTRNLTIHIQPKQGQLPALHKRGQDTRRPRDEVTIEAKAGEQPVDATHEGTIQPKQGENHVSHIDIDISGRPRQDGDPVECEGRKNMVVGEEGRLITSPNHPANYPNREKCAVRIVAENRECTLEIDCYDFHVQDSQDCRKDYLMIKENRWTKEKFCGDEGFIYESSKRALTLKFKSNQRVTDEGFSCLARSVCPTTTTTTTTTTASTPNITTTTTTEVTTTTSSTGSCQCGVANLPRVEGGEEVDPAHKYPWYVGIKYEGNSNYWCGGSIINDLYILTAAHCVDDITSVQGLVVGVADQDMTSIDDITQLVPVQIIVHPDYISNTLDSDIALLKLSQPLDLTHIRPVCLPADDSNTYAGEMATATGWGTLQSGESQPLILQEVTVPILDPSCPGHKPSHITENMLCTGPEQGGKDTCQGDSGGPLTVQNDSSKYVQVGINSWGYGCADPGSGGVYTRVNSYLDWIKAKISDAANCQ